MFNKINHSFSTLLAGIFLCIACFMAVSCDNLFDGADIKKELEEAIQINNSDPVTVYVQADDGAGSILSQTPLRLRKRESFELNFKPDNSYVFIKWEVLDRTTRQPVANAVIFEDENSVETKGQLLEAKSNLLIHAKTSVIPAIIDVKPEPGSGIYAYEPIVITFNSPVEAADVSGEDSVFNFDNIEITNINNGQSLTTIGVDLFEQPIFNSEKTELTIMPKAGNIIGYMDSNDIFTISVNVSLSDRIIISKDGLKTTLFDNGKTSFSFQYFYSPLETSIPVKTTLYVSREELTPDKICGINEYDERVFTQITTKFGEPMYDDQNTVLRNRAAEYIYIYGKYYDEGTGVRSVTISETRTHDIRGTDLQTNQEFHIITYENTYNRNNALFIQNGLYTEFFIKHKIQSEPGAVVLDIAVSDACGNTDEYINYIFTVGEDNWFKITPCNYQQYWFWDGIDEDEYNENIKTIKIEEHTSMEYIYQLGNWDETKVVLVDNSVFKDTICCSYINKDNQPDTTYLTYNRGWEGELNVNSVSGLKISMQVTDDIDHSYSKDCYFPSEPSVISYDNKIFIYGDEHTKYFWVLYNGRARGYSSKEAANGIEDFQSGLKFRVVPVSQEDAFYFDYYFDLAGPMTREYTVSDSAIPELNYMVQLKQEPYLKYFPEKNQYGVTLTLADNSWSKFDKIYYTTSYVDDERFYFTKGSNSYTQYLYETNSLYYDDIELNIYGIKGNCVTPALIKTITTTGVEQGTYDITPPEFGIDRWDFYNYGFDIEDEDSGFDYVAAVYKNREEWILGAEPDKTYYKVPVADLEKYADKSGYWVIKIYDKKGNYWVHSQKKTAIVDIPETITKVQGASNQWYIISDNDNKADYYSCRYIQKNQTDYTYLDDQEAWVSSGASRHVTFSVQDKSIARFAKRYRPDQQTWDIESGYGYFYTDAVKSTGKYDYVAKLNDKDFLVASDAPAFVHTIKTDMSYNDCKDWTLDDWEALNPSLGPVLMDFTDNPTAQKYTIPDGIEKGECFVVIAYFADCENGKPKKMKPFMTEVMVKK